MKILGVVLIVLSMVIGFISDSITNQLWFERAIGFSFGNFLFGIFILIKTSNCRFMRGVPNPPEHLRPGICYLNCGNTLPSTGRYKFCLNCGSSIVKRPEFPKDRIN